MASSDEEMRLRLASGLRGRYYGARHRHTTTSVPWKLNRQAFPSLITDCLYSYFCVGPYRSCVMVAVLDRVSPNVDHFVVHGPMEAGETLAAVSLAPNPNQPHPWSTIKSLLAMRNLPFSFLLHYISWVKLTPSCVFLILMAAPHSGLLRVVLFSVDFLPFPAP